MTYIIPNQTTKKIVQTNENDLSGNIYVTKNIDLRDNGYIKLSHFPFAVMTEDDDADFDAADVIFKGVNDIFIISDETFSGTGGFKKFTNRKTDTESPSPIVQSDGISFNNEEVILDGDYLKYRSADTVWTKLDFDISKPCQMAVLDTFNVLLIGYTNLVKMINTSWVLVKTLTIPSEYTITSIDTNGNTVYIGTKHNSNGEAKLFLWDGSSTAWNSAYGVNATGIMSVKKYGSSCAVVTTKGQLLQFNGSSFTVLGNLPPYYYKDSVEWAGYGYFDTISNRGMYVDGDRIYINVIMKSLSEKNQFNSTTPGGIWVYTPTTGLNCLNTYSYNRITTKTIATSAVNVTDNIITTTNVPITGTPVIYNSDIGTIIGGLNEKTVYYTIKLSDTTLKLATSYSNAIAGTAIDITGTGNNAQMLHFFPIYDYGHTFSGNRSSVCLLPYQLNINDYRTDNIIYTSDLVLPQKSVLNQTCPLLPNRGYFITPKLNSSNTEEVYNEILIKHKPLKDDEKIIIKYRTTERIGLPFGSIKGRDIRMVGTWTDTDTFTTTLDMSLAEIGDEIEIVAGKGAGMLFHISSLTNNSGTWTVNLDETFPYAVNSETMYFYVNNFKKLGEITKETSEGIDHKSVSLNKNSKFLQLKIELRGVDVTIEELQVSNKKFE